MRIFKWFLPAVASMLMLAPLTQAQTTWEADKAHSRLAFSTVHMGIADISGSFKDFDVKIIAEKADFSDAVFELSVDVASINTNVEMRDNHLRSGDFFDVEKYPKMTYTSTGIKKTGKDRYELTGNLTMHGVTKPVKMNLWYRGTVENEQSKSSTAGFQLTGVLKRSDFGIGSGFPYSAISDEVTIKADGEFKKK